MWTQAVDRYKWLEPRHLTSLRDRWGTDLTNTFHYMFFNGVGYEATENEWGSFHPFSRYNAEVGRTSGAISTPLRATPQRQAERVSVGAPSSPLRATTHPADVRSTDVGQSDFPCFTAPRAHRGVPTITMARPADVYGTPRLNAGSPAAPDHPAVLLGGRGGDQAPRLAVVGAARAGLRQRRRLCVHLPGPGVDGGQPDGGALDGGEPCRGQLQRVGTRVR